MQDDTTKRPTVEDQELADMIANLNGPAPTSAGGTTPAPDGMPVGSPAPASAPAPDLSGPLPPLPPQPTSTPVPAQNVVPETADPAPASVPEENSNFSIPDPSPGLTPLPTAGTPLPDLPTTPQPSEEEKFEPPASTLPPLGHKMPLPPLPGEENPDADIDEIAADFPDPSSRTSKLGKTSKRGDSDLSAIKQDVLDKLRPLVNELDLPPQEKFDTLLLLIRSNDDKSLIPQAYEAADKIEDETSRAAALLDIVKEIDYFENS